MIYMVSINTNILIDIKSPQHRERIIANQEMDAVGKDLF